MTGFFTDKEIESKELAKGKVLSCISCGLFTKCNSPRMKPYGKFKKRILNISEAPTVSDDRTGIPWSGGPGQILKTAYKKLGVDIYEDCLNVSAIKCYPGKGASPSKFEIDSCRRFLLKVIEEYKPDVIVTFGKSALVSVIGDRWNKNFGELSKWAGLTIPDRDLNAWVCPVLSPAQVLAEKERVEVRTVWEKHLKTATEHEGNPIIQWPKPKIDIITDLSPLRKIKSGDISFDYETTGLKPHAKGQKIICASVAYNAYHAFAFMMPETKKERMPFLELLENPNIGKMAHNMKFEITWSKVKLRQDINNMQWDSMLAAHILDNRPYITGLKFQTYVNFGVIDYSSEIEPYLQADEKNGNAINKIHKLLKKPSGTKKLLEYCALDSVYEYRLARIQQGLMNYQDLPF